MTKKELSQYYWLEKEIKADEERLKVLREQAEAPRAQQLTGMPHGSNGDKDQIGKVTAEIVDLQAIIAAKQIQCIHERQRIERFIAEIPDSKTRMIFTHRCIDGLSWQEVSVAMNDRISEGYARNLFYKYLKEGNADISVNDN